MQCIAPVNIPNPKNDDRTDRLVVPCGKCAICQQNRRTEWTSRLKHELQDSSSALFLTLTYKDENITFGEVLPTLVKSDLQKFFKRMRKFIEPKKIRYYAIGEYGTTTFRPHYHIILFNYPIQLKDEIPNLWKMGHTHIGSVSPASIHYVTKYHLNKTEYPEGSEPSFATMSRRPGIGFGYIKRSGSYHEGNIDRNYLLHEGGIKSRLPRYYKTKLYNDKELKQIERKYKNMERQFDTDEIVQEHYRKNPDVNFYDYYAQQQIHLQENFKVKINKKEKL